MSSKNRNRDVKQPTGTTTMTSPEQTTDATAANTGTETNDQPQDTGTVGTNETETKEVVTETQAPVPTGAPSTTSMGDVIAPKEAINVATLLREKGTFEQAVDEVIESGSVVLATVAGTLREYQATMGHTGAVSESVINAQQGAFWRILRMVFNSGEDFEAGMLLIIGFVREGRATAFSDANMFRGFEHTKLNSEHSKAFQSVLTLISTAAGVQNRKNVSRTLDLGRAMGSAIFTNEARTRVMGFFA